MYVIAGVSGQTGSVAASTLLGDRRPVRVIVRDEARGEPWRARGAQVALASLGDRAALAEALAGADGAYLLLPPTAFDETDVATGRRRYIDAIAGAVEDARPGHVVLLSSIGAERASGTGPIAYLHALESRLRDGGVPATFLRAAFFAENWGAMAQGAIAGGALHYAVRGDLRFAQVATPDIGRTAAHLLVEGPPPGGTRIVQLAGPADLTLGETAAALGRAAGVPIDAVSIPPEAMIGALVGMGASREMASLYGELAAALDAGLIRWQPGDVLRGCVTVEDRLRELLAR
jgi:uncharacterized protein YbjT (DUF2867 family)